MTKQKVKFISSEIEKTDAEASLPAKFRRLLDSYDLKNNVDGKTVAIKMHLGANIGYTTIHPLFVSILVDKIKNAGGTPFITDVFNLNSENLGVRGAKTRGYTEDILGAPLIPVAGVFDKYYYSKKVDFKSLEEVQIAGNIHDADVMIDLSHFKGHGVCSFGGAAKNIAMGCVTQKTRRDLHGLEGGIVWDEDKCDRCEECINECRYQANSFNDEGKYQIFFHNCTYCQHCVEICHNDAISFEGQFYKDFQKGMAIAVDETFKTFADKSILYINVLMDITMRCDCWGFSTPSLVPDIGILSSYDIVAIEKASLDMIRSEDFLQGSLPKDRELTDGNHLFEKIWGKDPYIQIEVLQDMKLGNSDYTIEEIK
jgi:uncharacterized Fe-S center protein